MKILITGATGFIGRHLTAALSKIYPTRCFVRKTSDISAITPFNVEIVYGDLLIRDTIISALDGIDLIYHLAGEVYSRKKNDYFKGNILATQNLLEACEKKGGKRIIFLSSVAVYKPATSQTLLREDSECKPITVYGKTKLETEELIKKSNVPWVIIRAPVIYGPHQPPVLNAIFLNAIKKGKIYVIGQGNNLRSLCFVENLKDGMVLLAARTDVVGRTYILSDNTSYSYNEIIKTASKVIGQEIKGVYLPNFFGDILWKLNELMDHVFGLFFVELYAVRKMQLEEAYDITKARKEINYNPTVSLEAGIRKTIAWLQDYHSRG